MKRHYVYVVRCSDSSLYTGYTTDLTRRLAEHNGEVTGAVGAKYTKPRRPVVLVFSQYFYSRSKAQAREVAIKKLSKEEKEALIRK